jgi:hypothetical protein
MNKKTFSAAALLTTGLVAGSFMSIAGASAASTPTATPAAPSFKQHVAEEAVTGTLASTLGDLAKARVADATVVRVEKDSDGMAVYEVHMVKTDGTRVDVYFDANNAITKVETKAARSNKGEGKGPRSAQEVVTGTLATTLSNLAKARVTDATVDRVVKDDRGGAAYAVLMKKADGSKVVVHFDSSNAILSVDAPPAHEMGKGMKGQGKGGQQGKGRH